MKPFRFIALLAASLLIGLVVSAAVTMVTWEVRIEDKAFHCTDIGFGSYWTDMDSHHSAGDSLSPGWTWERLTMVRLHYIEAFWLLWIVGAAIPFLFLGFRRPPPNEVTRANASHLAGRVGRV
jgi:hypothetical protein